MANDDIKKGKQKYLFIAGKGEKCGVTIEIIVMIPQKARSHSTEWAICFILRHIPKALKSSLQRYLLMNSQCLWLNGQPSQKINLSESEAH